MERVSLDANVRGGGQGIGIRRKKWAIWTLNGIGRMGIQSRRKQKEEGRLHGGPQGQLLVQGEVAVGQRK